MDYKDRFFLGKNVENDEPILYDPGDLTTHAVVVGMTGSGKTGLCIDLLEEAALNRYPALMIDPKGDITNALLHFPDLLPEDFKPWINADEARREGKPLEQAAEEIANLWRNGLGKWGIDGERISKLNENVKFTIYTPGSTAGVPVSILSSLKAPDLDDTEIIREKISGTVIAILGLVGMTDIDPVKSKEHILLSNIFEHNWSQGKDLDLGELILQTQKPPFEKLGVFDLDSFIPSKDRDELAFTLNNILAAPSFATWIEGVPLDVESMLWDESGKPRHSIFYIAHLTDEERMFFITLLYSAVESWMRSQKGTTSLRAIVYFDEIFGYLPPVANPPSKELMLRMLKQGRAFGVSQVLVTQNPVDLDYKGLSNIGTWCIGKLQTERDKERLVDGLVGVTSGSIDKQTFDKVISGLEKRQFLLHNVHERAPQVFRTRWAMNYLAGPMTRSQIPDINALVGIGEDEVTGSQPEIKAAAVDAAADLGTTARPKIPAGVYEYFLPVGLSVSSAISRSGKVIPEDAEYRGVLYKPTLISQVQVRYLQNKYQLDTVQMVACLVRDPNKSGLVRWDSYLVEEPGLVSLDESPARDSSFATLSAPLNSSKTLNAMEKDFVDWVYQTQRIELYHHKLSGTYSEVGMYKEDFLKTIADELEDALEDEIDKLKAKYKTKVQSIQKKIKAEERELSQDEEELKQRKMEELGTHAENILGFVTGSRSKRRVSTSLTKRRMTSKAKADVEESLEVIEELEEELAKLTEELNQKIEEMEQEWEDQDENISVIAVTPYKKDIHVDMFGVAWQPYHLLVMGEEVVEIPGIEE
jgi:hypothetical protein